ncbi:Predicted Zn-dependent protease or its inactivated homolog [Pedobacter steynii]|uniref:Predicted Zn-dependent protease or its inactivated homolog n=1 Tax=Pedobacter steynii TaxID=430522 RepID=A0A1H0D193_9SPHI|nr:TldD/PmbA family protein [Pedobacter steynii]NQX41721.1 TldD/PmbA family protein [Pedobacter steynii]SDN63950.1 Predicted Zn-dependent protease or its inactivated homolog [Pedobacter steynii]
MAILNKEEAQAILKKVLSFSKAEFCEISLNGSDGGNIRYARNAVSTAGQISVMDLSVSSTFGKKTGTATINEFDDASLQKVVKRAEELAMLAPENPEFMPLLGAQDFEESPTYNENTAAMTPDTRAEMVGKSLQVSKAANLEAAGFLENSTRFGAIMNSKGLFAYNKRTNVAFSVTVRNQAGTGSGYIEQQFNDLDKMDTLALSKIAASKALGSATAKAIEPGKYTVILEPLAASDMLGNMFRGFDARSADEGRSFMSKKGGGTRLGEQLFSENVNIYSDPMNPEVPSAAWSEDGLKVKRTQWVEKGVVKNLAYSRYWAGQKGVEPVPFNRSIVMEGGTQSLEELIKSTEKGILVTRFWYIRSVDPQTLLLTGLTRDGTFYIENGEIKFPVKNFRFNESPVIMLNNVEALGKPVRTGSGMIPPMKIRDFTFTSLSDAV